MFVFTVTDAVVSPGYQDAPAIRIHHGEKPTGEKTTIARFKCGHSVYDTRVANNYRWTNFSVKAFGSVAEHIEAMNLHVGSHINMHGHIVQEQFQNNDDPQKTTKILVFIVDGIEYASKNLPKGDSEPQQNDANGGYDQNGAPMPQMQGEYPPDGYQQPAAPEPQPQTGYQQNAAPAKPPHPANQPQGNYRPPVPAAPANPPQNNAQTNGQQGGYRRNAAPTGQQQSGYRQNAVPAAQPQQGYQQNAAPANQPQGNYRPPVPAAPANPPQNNAQTNGQQGGYRRNPAPAAQQQSGYRQNAAPAAQPQQGHQQNAAPQTQSSYQRMTPPAAPQQNPAPATDQQGGGATQPPANWGQNGSYGGFYDGAAQFSAEQFASGSEFLHYNVN